MIKNSILLFAIFFIISCGGKQYQEAGDAKADEAVCGYNFIDDSFDFTWTAYKFTEKKGVPGTFKDIKVSSEQNSTSRQDLLNSITFTLATSSVFSNEPVRDAKISQFFFGNMKNTSAITGKLIMDNNEAMVALTLNDLTIDIPATLTYSGDTVILSSTVDFEQFQAQEAIKILNQVCSEQHKGVDGKSVFWNTVDIKAKAIVSTNCD